MFDKNTIVPCVDWFRGIVPIDDVKEFCRHLEEIDERLKFDNFDYDGRSMLNFKKRYLHVEVPSLTFAFNPINEDEDCLYADPNHNNKHILFSLSGDAIRYLGSDSLRTLLYWLHSVGTKCTRIDFALDFFDKDNDIVPLMQEGCKNFMNPGTRDITVAGRIKRTPSNYQCFINAYPGGEPTVNYTLGNHGSDHGMFRLYDKKFETLFGRNKKFAYEILEGRDYWYRAELELHNGKDIPWANDAFSHLISADFNLYAVFGHCIDSWFSFKVLCYANRTEYVEDDTWEAFIDDLVSCIHFVQLVHTKYVNRDTEYFWAQLQHNSVWLSALSKLALIDPARYRSILQEGLHKRTTIPKHKQKYYCLSEVI